MMRVSLLCAGFIGLAACMPPSILGQGSPCLATDPDTSSVAVSHTRDYFSGPDSAGTVNAGGLWARRDQIYAVADSATCSQGVTAINAALSSSSINQVYAVRVGTSGFFVREPSPGPDGRYTYWLFNTSWQHIGLPVMW
jgi:hypothetical protein